MVSVTWYSYPGCWRGVGTTVVVLAFFLCVILLAGRVRAFIVRAGGQTPFLKQKGFGFWVPKHHCVN